MLTGLASQVSPVRCVQLDWLAGHRPGYGQNSNWKCESMSLKGILDLINRHPMFPRPGKVDAPPGKPFEVTVRQGARPVYIAALWESRRVPTLVITPRPEDARRLHDQLLTYLGEEEPVHLLPEPEVLPFERLAVDANTSNQRLAALASLACAYRPEDREAHPVPLVVASVSSALRSTLPMKVMAGTDAARGGGRDIEDAGEVESNTWSVGQRIRLDQVLPRWIELGYHSEPVVEVPGTFSLRGGILDIFPANAEFPFRIELWDDEVETIRRFDPHTQRSLAAVLDSAGDADRVSIIPAREQLPAFVDRERFEDLIGGMDFRNCGPELRERIEEELASLLSAPNQETLAFYSGLLNHVSLLEYLPEDARIVLELPNQIDTEAQDLEERFDRMKSGREERGELPRGFPSPFLPWESFAAELQRRPRVLVQGWLGETEDNLFQPAPPYYGRLEHLGSDARRFGQQGKAIVAVTQHARRLSEILEEQDVNATVVSRMDHSPGPGEFLIVPGSLREGWYTEDAAPYRTDANGDGGNGARPGKMTPLMLLSDAELFGTVKERRYRRPRRAEPGTEIANLSDLVEGSYVVHIDHGVARFVGTTRMGDDGADDSWGGGRDSNEKEYLVLEYAENDKLYVPTEHLDRVTAYVGAQDHPPNLTRLGSAEWARVKQRVKGAARELASELLRVQAARELAEGHEFSADSVWQQELEDSFPYEETPDQAAAISDVKTDMEQTKPMDRLICGDVGYGKTEIALRASFKTVNDGMQVGLLVPTTVLAQQHYATFSERLSPYPIKVDVLSRFRTRKEQQQVIRDLKDGTLDIVIGTHRLLQKDVRFKNLGLAVVDEEQRFGVAHKEQLKKLRREVDVLTLSATPIPRTLNLALSGIRDLSTMDTAPEARLPVKTFVSEYSEEVIKEAILREMERGGQVFFLHNRVRSIEQKAAELAELVPQARLLIGHGQMAEADLEDVMYSFANGEADVLLCTTIIESGLDMPNVNTLIVDRADRFGLAQLYQLRGRVGRGDHRAYAYMLVPGGRRITDAAHRRLEAILEAAELGAGFRIAMRDLEIRGAGNLLGSAQSGHIREVGLDLYGQLLKEAVDELKHGEVSDDSTGGALMADLPRVEIQMPARIPESYIAHMASRLSIYQRAARIRERHEVPELAEELKDRFGPPPEEVENLLRVAELRALASRLGVESILQSSDGITVNLKIAVGGARQPLQRALGPSANVGNQRIHMPARRLGDQWFLRLTRVLERLQSFQDRVRALAG